MAGDFNGDGFVELANYKYNCYSGTTPAGDETTRFYTCSGISTQAGKMTGITDGLGNTTAVTYDTFSNPNIYSRNTITTDPYPIATPSLPLSVVRSVIAGNGAAGQEQTAYNYGGLRVHMAGKGILGMTTFRRVNYSTGMTDETIISGWDTISYQPSAVTTERHTVSEGVTSNTSYTHSARQCGGGRKAFFTYPHSNTTSDFDNNTTTTTNTYDTQICLPTETRVVNAGGQRVISYSSYILKGGRYLPGRIETTTTYTGKPPFAEIVSYAYDDKGRCSSLTTDAGTSSAVTTSYTYDDCGNMLSSTVQDVNGSLEAIVKTWEYDSSKRCVTRSTERGYIVKEYTHDLWGNVLTETDRMRPAYPQTTRYTYDGWGNLTLTELPTGQKKKYTRGWDGSGAGRYFVVEQGTAMPWVKTIHDGRGRVVCQETIGAKELSYLTTTEYNQLGKKARVDTYHGNQRVCTDSYQYDQRGRLTEEHHDSDPDVAYSYGNRSVTTSIAGRSSTETHDSWGNTVETTDPAGTVTTYQYGSHGKPLSVTSCGATVTMGYDAWGNQTRLTDPDAGTMTYTYDAYGRVKTQRDGRAIETSYEYDEKGRLYSSTTGGVTTAYTYGQTADNRGLLMAVARGSNSISYAYDSFGRTTQETRDVIGLGNRTFQYEYGPQGTLTKTHYPGGLTVSYTYDSYGNRTEMRADSSLVWALQTNVPYVTQEKLGSNLTHSMLIGSHSGRPEVLHLGHDSAPIDYDLSYDYDSDTYNMTRRSGMFPEDEFFTYDNLDRLTCIEYGNVSTRDISYAPNGNITTMTDIGRYYYEGSKPHAVTAVDNTRRKIPTSQLDTQYNAFGKVSQIRDYGESSYRMLLDYGPDNERWRTRMYKEYSSLQRTTYYMGDYEETVKGGTTRRFYYLGGNVLYKKQTSQPDSVFYLFTDHLGSVVAIVDQNGSEKFHASYDAWGNQTVTRNDIKFHRGYTGHEMLPEFGLINMNGRLYDPQIGRFLSTDNYVQEPWNSQNFNRYSYCLNNPLKYTDPDGEWFGIDDFIAMIIGGTLNLGANLIQGNVNNFWQGLALFGVGAVAGETALYSGGLAPFVSSGLISVGNDLVNQGFTNGFSNINWNQVRMNFLMSELTASFSYGLEITYGAHLNDLIQKLKIESPVINRMLYQSFMMGTSGTVIEGGLTLANEGTMEEAGKAALRGGAYGFVSGAISGFADGVKSSYKKGINPWTGEKMSQRVTSSDYQAIIDVLELQPTIDRINNGQILSQYRHDGSVFGNYEGILPQIQGTYREWVVPTPGLPANNPGAQRIVTSDGMWFYTPDHYHTFIRIR